MEQQQIALGILCSDIPSGGGTIVLSYVGYEDQEIPVSKEANLSIVLKQKDASVDEVVVVGLWFCKKIRFDRICVIGSF